MNRNDKRRDRNRERTRLAKGFTNLMIKRKEGEAVLFFPKDKDGNELEPIRVYFDFVGSKTAGITIQANPNVDIVREEVLVNDLKKGGYLND